MSKELDIMATQAPAPQNKNLHAAKRNKNDEFYTQMADIERELVHYRKQFAGKTVFCNCDDPSESNFVRYFALNFDFLKLKKVISTHYDDTQSTYKLEITRKLGAVEEIDALPKIPLKQNGDFRSPECIEILKESDIVCTNPPFSLFREYIAQLIAHNKKFLVIGSIGNVGYREIFPLLAENRIWLGYHSGDMSFMVPDYYEPMATRYWQDENGQKWRSLGNICWFTNMDHKRRHEEIILFKNYHGHEEEYPIYDNLDAIDVKKVRDIPNDYNGKIGVPRTFVTKHNPNQFDIIGYRYGSDGKSLTINGWEPYSRILIRRKQ